MLPKNTNKWINVHGITNDIARHKQEGGSILWMYIGTSKLPSTSNKQHFVDHFLLSRITAIPLDSHGGDEMGHLVWTQGNYNYLWRKYGRR